MTEKKKPQNRKISQKRQTQSEPQHPHTHTETEIQPAAYKHYEFHKQGPALHQQAGRRPKRLNLHSCDKSDKIKGEPELLIR